MDKLCRGVADSHTEELRIAAHALKSSSLNLGARAFAATCQLIETQGRGGKLNEVQVALAGAEADFVDLVAELKRREQSP